MSYINSLPKDLKNLLDRYFNYDYWKIIYEIYRRIFTIWRITRSLLISDVYFIEKEDILKSFGFKYNLMIIDATNTTIMPHFPRSTAYFILDIEQLITYNDLITFLQKYIDITSETFNGHHNIINSILELNKVYVRIAIIMYENADPKYMLVNIK